MRAVALSCLLALTGCDIIAGLDGFDVVSAGGAGGSAGDGGSGGAGGEGGAGPPLRDEGLIARYFIDEQNSGDPSVINDRGGQELNLTAEADPNMQYEATLTGRGLVWDMANGPGHASRVGVGSALGGTTTATIEAVVSLSGVAMMESRLFHIGSTAAGRLALGVAESSCQININDANFTRWALTASLRQVVHVRIDLEAGPAERARFFVGGVEQMDTNGVYPTPVALNIPATAVFYLGNRFDDARSPSGSIYYFALYGIAMSPEDITYNAGILGQGDDY
jgi:hypothetical protein